MPTRDNIEKLDELQNSLSTLVELKKVLDRAEAEMRMLKKRKELFLGGEGEEERAGSEIPSLDLFAKVRPCLIFQIKIVTDF